VQVGGKILVPPDSTIHVMASQIVLPGGSDLMVSGISVLRVSGREPAVRAACSPSPAATSPCRRMLLPRMSSCLAAFTPHYSVTAIMALADPEPGSSMSTTAGASFTL
jgi:hypothetical protein